MSRRGGSAGGGRSKVSCAKPVDPPFIQKIKEQIGWKAGPTLESKHEQLPTADDDDPEFEAPSEEKPTVVVLKPGDLTAEEADEIQKEADLNDRTPGRYKYRKPAPKPNEVTTTVSSVKRPSSSDTTGRDSKREKVASEDGEKDTSVKKDPQPTASRNLLSFGDDDEEED